jgi:YHS domain-containing protein
MSAVSLPVQSRWSAVSRTWAGLLLLAVVLVATGCGTTHAVHVTPTGTPVMLLGHDPVSYFGSAAAPQRGSKDFQSRVGERVYYFASASNKQRFDADPARFEPRYGGFCANGAAYGMKWASNPTSFEVVDGRLFIFSGASSRAMWALDQRDNIAAADRLWADEMQDAGWRWQSIKRMVFKVPHYRSTEALRARWDAQNPGKEPPASQNGGFWNNLTRSPGWQAATGMGQEALGFPQ